MLVTREHVGLIDKEHPFLATTIKRSFRAARVGQEFDVITAVVDRIPFPRNCSFRNSDDGQSPISHQSLGGHAGISIATMDSSQAAPNLWTNDASSTRKKDLEFGNHSTLSLCFTEAGYGDREVQMPVANTTFVNGRSATFLVQRWINGADSSRPSELICTKERELQDQRVRVANGEDPNSFAYKTTISLRLRPITPPRVVIAAIGNIVRQIALDNADPQPASQELERSISDQIESGRIQRNKADVWALLRPQHAATDDPPSSSKIEIAGEITKGARLLKVLSGGGGWGEKQGLLALDPDWDYRSEDDKARNFAQNDEVFADIVNRGDIITFFVSDVIDPDSHDESTQHLGARLGQSQFKLQRQLLEFGCLPSTMDEIPGPLRKVTDPPLESPAILIRKYFGMLSEAGMSLKVGQVTW